MEDLFNQKNESGKKKRNLDYLIQDIRNARAQAAMIDPADVSAALELSDNLKNDLLLLADEVAEYENQAKALDLYKKDITERQNRLKGTADTLREIILQAMDMNDIPNISAPACTMSISRRKPSIRVTDEVLIPRRFLVPQPAKVDLNGLKAEWNETGELFPGCDLDNGKISLTIRRK